VVVGEDVGHLDRRALMAASAAKFSGSSGTVRYCARSHMNDDESTNLPTASPWSPTTRRSSAPLPSGVPHGVTTTPPTTVCAIHAEGTRCTVQVAMNRS
jgi:hypothetical protein